MTMLHITYTVVCMRKKQKKPTEPINGKEENNNKGKLQPIGNIRIRIALVASNDETWNACSGSTK